MTLQTHITTSEIPLAEALAAANAGVLELPWKEGTWLKVRGPLTTLPGVFDQLEYEGPADQILCDPRQLAEVAAPFLKNRTFPPSCRPKSYDSLYTW